MGVHFTVTANHDLKETELEAIRTRFAPLSSTLASLAAQVDPVQWRDASEAGSVRPYLFYTPGGFTLNVGPKALRFHHGTPFSAFVESGVAQQLLRRFSSQLAALFHQPRVIYAPCEGVGEEIDLWVDGGLSVSEIVARLRTRAEPPAEIGALAGRSGEGRYYAEEFHHAPVGDS
jgi:hypothetical protein